MDFVSMDSVSMWQSLIWKEIRDEDKKVKFNSDI